MNDAVAWRRFYAEEIQIAANLTTAALVDALATIPRERFLPPGPWTIRGEADFQAAPRQTPDADPRHVHHNIAVAIDASRMLFNGAPGLIAMAIDQLALGRGSRVLHIGTGLGYYTALMAQCVGGTGRVIGIEVDPELAERSRANLADCPWVEVRHGDGSEPPGEIFDAILVNAGVTHPLPAWLDALRPDVRIIFPLTVTVPPMTAIGKGPLVLATKSPGRERLAARFAGYVAIYSAIGLRDDSGNQLLGQALRTSPFAPIKSLRLDAHPQESSCWIHAPSFCLSLASADST